MGEIKLTFRQMEILAALLAATEQEGSVALSSVAQSLGMSARGFRKQRDAIQKALGWDVVKQVSGGRYTATQRAAALLPNIAEYREAATKLLGQISVDHSNGPIRIDCFAGQVHRLYEGLAKQTPEIQRLKFQIVEDLRYQLGIGLMNELADYRTDLVVASSDAKCAPSILRLEPALYRWQLLAVSPPSSGGLPEQGKPEVLCGLDLLVSPVGHQSRAILDDAALEAGVTLQYVMESASTTSRWYLSQAGFGTVIAPSDALYLRPPDDSGCVILDPKTEKPLGGGYSLFCRGDDERVTQFELLATQLAV